MPTNLGVSEVIDKHGVTADIEAKRFDGTRTVQIQGDVTASQTWNGDSSSPLTLNASIGAKKVTQDKIGDKAVGTGQMDDGSVGLTQMDPNAMNGTVQDNDSKLATHSAVKTYVDSQISGQGTYLGKHTVAEINAFVTDNLHNGDRVMVSDSGTINLGPGGVGFDVIAGEDLILYKSGSTVQWDTMDGNFKTKQNAVSKAGSTTKTVTAFSQNENGDADVTYEEIQRASTSHEGLVQLTDSHASTSTTTAATPNSVKSAYDLANDKYSKPSGGIPKTDLASDVQTSLGKADSALQSESDPVFSASAAAGISSTDINSWNGKADKVSGATNGNFAALDSNGNLTDSGKKASDFELVTNKVTSWQGTPDDTHYPSEKLVKDALDAKADANKVVAIADAVVCCGEGSVSDKWFKVAELARPITSLADNAIGLWNITFYKSAKTFFTTAIINVRNNTDVLIAKASILSEDDEILNEFDAKVVVRGLHNNRSCELWLSSSKNTGYFGFSISEIQSGNYTAGYRVKYKWIYHDYYGSESGSAEPQSDVSNNVVAEKLVKLLRQKNIPSPTNNNLVAMDENGLVKDSGVAVLPSTSTWDGTSDAKVPTAKAVQAKLDGKQDSITFMNDSEAVAIWNDAKTAAANAS